MPIRRAHITSSAAQSELTTALADLRVELKIPADFPSDVLEGAQEAASAADPMPDRVDLRAIPFCTIDPQGSKDLDQALHIERAGAGFTVRYAIADVPSFVMPGGALDTESRRRGQTLYAPDARVPLYPTVLSEGAASLLPDEDRRALVWRFALDARAQVTDVALDRAMVRSVRQWSYVDAQAAVDAGMAPESLELLAVIGPLRQQLERERGGASLDAPDEEIIRTEHGYDIERRSPLPIEDWNAQVSLLTGMAAATVMLDGGVGILRTMPPAGEDTIAAFRRQTKALGIPWADGVDYGEYLRSLDRDSPAALAVMQAASGLFRGAGYLAFARRPAEDPVQAAIGAPYAHVTAPLRRLVDRFGLEICHALLAHESVPAWARDGLAALPSIMGSSSALAGRLDAGAIDRVEAAILSSRVGETFDAVVLSVGKGHARVQLLDPVVTASMDAGDAAPGSSVRVRLVSADIATGTVVLERVPQAAAS